MHPLGTREWLQMEKDAKDKARQVVIGGEVVDVPAAFEPFVGKQWAVVGSTNHPTEWPAFFDAAQALGWEFRYAHLRDGWAYLYFQRLRRSQTSLRDLVMK